MYWQLTCIRHLTPPNAGRNERGRGVNLYIIINMLDRTIGWETELFLGNLAELHPSCLVLFQFISLRSKICYFTCVTVQILICRIKYTHINFYAIDSIVDIALIAVVLPYLRSKNTVFSTNFQLISELHTLGLRSPTPTETSVSTIRGYAMHFFNTTTQRVECSTE